MKLAWRVWVFVLMLGVAAACQPAMPTPARTDAQKAPAAAESQKPQPTPQATREAQPTQAPTAPPAPAAKVNEPTSAPADKPKATAGAQAPGSGLPTSLPAVPTAAPAAPTAAAGAPTTTRIVPQPSATAPIPPQPTSLPTAEERLVELEWPSQMSLGDSDVVRLSLAVVKEGYVVRAEFPEHTIESQPLTIDKPAGYQLSALARLDGPGFDIAPDTSQESILLSGKPAAWRWSISPRRVGTQRLAVSLTLRWLPDPGSRLPEREQAIFSRAVQVRVISFLGLSRGEALFGGLFGLVLGGGISLAALSGRRRDAATTVRVEKPNPRLVLEPRDGMTLSPEESDLLRALFRRYGRVVLHNEFLSGYSGARTFLAQPVLPDGRSDAFTIAKLGPENLVRREFANYETYVKDSLPPVTARIQQPPVRTRKGSRAGLQYTFIAEPGRPSTSLRLALLAEDDPGWKNGCALLRRMFETFGPNWWMQRRAYPFRLCQEYDHLLPPHAVLQPVEESARSARELNERLAAGQVNLRIGDLVRVAGFSRWETRADGHSLTLSGIPGAGQPALRLRWLAERPPKNTLARVVGLRVGLLQEAVRGFERFDLPDPLAPLDRLLQETVQGTRSTIHGDLNLENVLVGPGGLVWLIDFAATREGHPLYDFARLYTEIVTQVIAARGMPPADFIRLVREGGHPLLGVVEEIGRRCLRDPAQPREFTLALYMACVGALKFSNLSTFQKHLLYLAAGAFLEKL